MKQYWPNLAPDSEGEYLSEESYSQVFANARQITRTLTLTSVFELELGFLTKTIPIQNVLLLSPMKIVNRTSKFAEPDPLTVRKNLTLAKLTLTLVLANS